MNIAYFTDTYKPQINGVVTSIEIFRQKLEEKGHNVYIFAPIIDSKKEEQSDKVFRFRSAKFIFQPEHRVTWPYSRALNKFKELDIDIIHSHTPFSLGLLAVHLAKKHHIPLIHTYHTLFTEYMHYIIPGDYAKNFAKWASKNYCNKNNMIIVPSEAVKTEIESYNITTPINIIPTGIDLTDYEKTITTEVKRKYDLKNDIDYLVTISRLGKEKNIPFLLKSFKQINDKNKRTQLIIIGDGPEKSNLEKEAKELGIIDNVIFTGYIDRTNIFPLLKYSKVFIFASKTETQGLVLLEAMSMKIPVIAIDAMGVCEVLGNRKGGYLTKEDQNEFSEITQNLLTDEQLYKQKSDEAYTLAQSLSANKMTNKLIKLYNKHIE